MAMGIWNATSTVFDNITILTDHAGNDLGPMILVTMIAIMLSFMINNNFKDLLLSMLVMIIVMSIITLTVPFIPMIYLSIGVLITSGVASMIVNKIKRGGENNND